MKICKSSCDEEVKKLVEEKEGLLANVRKMKGELKMAAEREKKMMEKNQALSQKYLDLHLSSKRRDSQVRSRVIYIFVNFDVLKPKLKVLRRRRQPCQIKQGCHIKNSLLTKFLKFQKVDFLKTELSNKDATIGFLTEENAKLQQDVENFRFNNQLLYRGNLNPACV